MYLGLKNCRVVDPETEGEQVIDVGIRDGRISTLGDLGHARLDKAIDVDGRYLMPALVDLHTHVYHLGTSLGVNADEIGRRSGVGVFVDAGSAGAGNFAGFREYVIKRSSSTIYSLLNLSFGGIPFFGIQKNSQAGEIPNIDVADADACLDCIRRNRRYIVGIKLRLGAKANGEIGAPLLKIAKKCADALRMPLMLHIGPPPPDIGEVLALLGKGDILTHSFRPFPNSITEGERMSKGITAARRRGVLIDIGHGKGSFSYKTAAVALKNGFLPDIISTDIHALSVPSPVHDLPTTMTKFLNLGMEVPKIVKAVTYTPAKAIRRPKHGSIELGQVAELVTMEVANARTTLKDSTGAEMSFERVIRPVLRISGANVGRVPWKLPSG